MKISKRSSYLGFYVRAPYASEKAWFAAHKEIAGYASSDECIVINPYLRLTESQIESVCINEAYRLLMYRWKIVPEIMVTDEQRKLFKNTPYASDENALKQTIIARIASKDPSAGKVTEEQRGYVACLFQILEALGETAIQRL